MSDASTATPRDDRPRDRYLSEWTTGNLPEPPPRGLSTWLRLVGPGVLLAGSSIGSGEWLFGPSVTARYGSTLLWLATLSILAQVFCNLQMMRYAAYCGESVVVGFLRTWPGPKFWMIWYAILDSAAIWPFNAANAAVPLAAVMLGHLPGDRTTEWLGITLSEGQLVRALGYVIFLAAFVPLVFGGTIYKSLERVFRFKLIVVLLFLIFTTTAMVSWSNMATVAKSFVRVGVVPLRAQSVVSGRHFELSNEIGGQRLVIEGTIENGEPAVINWIVRGEGDPRKLNSLEATPAGLHSEFLALRERAKELAKPGEFYVAVTDAGQTLTVRGRIEDGGQWVATGAELATASGTKQFGRIEELPAPWAERAQSLVEHQGIEPTSLWSYWGDHHSLPPLDWAMLAAFAAIAGAGGMTNTLFSNFARDAGWGMGANVGAIPSAFGGHHVKLSHVGQVFPLDGENRRRWFGWLRHIRRDQIGIWMLCSFLGMALPCMLSLEFIRNTPVAGDRVAAMMADGMANRYPEYRQLLWVATLACGFLVLAPGQILSGDMIARRWTDIVWVVSAKARQVSSSKVQRIYYGILLLYAAWGLVALALFDPLQIAVISGVLMNFALGWSAIHAVWVNVTLLPRELRPAWWMHVGSLFCGVFFIGISAIVLLRL